MDFTINEPAPVAITINGQAYNLPLFLTPQMTKWSAEIRKQISDEATEHLSPDDKARFKNYFQPFPVDVADLIRRATSSEGADYICNEQMKTAGVPDEIREKFLKWANPMAKRALAERLVQSPQVMSQLGVSAEEKTDPLSPPKGTSEGAPATGNATTPEPSASTAGSQQT